MGMLQRMLGSKSIFSSGLKADKDGSLSTSVIFYLHYKIPNSSGPKSKTRNKVLTPAQGKLEIVPLKKHARQTVSRNAKGK